jgi:hypothetical protein
MSNHETDAMSWLDSIFGGWTPPRSIEIEAVRVRVEATDEPNDHEQRAVEYLEKADCMVYSATFDRVEAVAVIGVGYAVLAVVEELRSPKRHSD